MSRRPATSRSRRRSLLDGGFPLNAPGELYIEVGGAITVAAGGPISARTRGANEYGCIRLTAGTTITIAARIDATGGHLAIPIEIEAEGDIAVTAPIDTVPSRSPRHLLTFDSPYGGSINIFSHSGSLVVGAPLYTTGAGSGGWDIGLTGCDVTVASSGLLSTGQDFPGSINIAAERAASYRRPRDGRSLPTQRGSGVRRRDHPGIPGGPAASLRRNSEMHPAPEFVPGGYGDLGACPRCGDGKVDGNEAMRRRQPHRLRRLRQQLHAVEHVPAANADADRSADTDARRAGDRLRRRRRLHRSRAVRH